MKTTFTLFLMMAFFSGYISAQDKKSQFKKHVNARDSVSGYKIVTRSSDPLILIMPVDTIQGVNVKMPNSFRKGLVSPVPMPTHKVEMVNPKMRVNSAKKR